MVLNKRGTDKILSIYWFTILFIVAAAIVIMIAMYLTPSDIRKTEASILTSQVADCFVEKGILNESVTQDNFLQKCHLNFEVENIYNWDDDQYFVEVKFYKFGTNDFARETIRKGNPNFDGSCKDTENLNPVCNERNLFAVNSTGQYTLKIKTIVRKTEKNVK